MRLIILTIVSAAAISGCGVSDADRAAQYALMACEEKTFEDLDAPAPSAKFSSLSTIEVLDAFIQQYPEIAAKYESELLAHRRYLTQRDEWEEAYKELETEKSQFLRERDKNARAAALLDDSYERLVNPPSMEVFQNECAAIEEVYQ